MEENYIDVELDIRIDDLLTEFCNKFPYGNTYDLARFMYVKGMEDSKNNN